MRARVGFLMASCAILIGFSCRTNAQTEISSPAFTVDFDAAGSLTSLRVQNREDLLHGTMEFCPNVKWALDSVDAQGAKKRILLKSDKGAGEIDVDTAGNSLTLTLTQKTAGFSNWQIPFSEAVVGVENLQDCTPTAAEAIQYRDHGEVYATPLPRLARVQRSRLYLKSGQTVLFWHEGWGAPFNLDELGGWTGANYRRGIFENNKPMRVVFELEPPHTKSLIPLQPAPVFVPYGESAGNLFLAGSPIQFSLNFPNAAVDRLGGARSWNVLWTVRDTNDQIVTHGAAQFKAQDVPTSKSVRVSFPMGQRGWFSVVFALKPVESVQPAFAPSEYRTRFAVVSKADGLLDPSAAAVKSDRKLDEYGYMALIGLHGMRESHNMRDFFPERGKANWQALDQVMDRASQEAKQWQTTWFFQANSRPAWCSEADYEQIAFDMVNRYKDRCKIWEVENEPNFSYSPDDYVRKALVPFAKGAKRADPNCQIMGPDCVSVPNTIRFVEAIVRLDALKYLDAVSTHTYMGPGEPWELFGNPQYLEKLHTLIGSRPLWQTEQGYQWAHSSRREQARYALRQFLNGEALGIPSLHQYYFYPVHNGFEPWYLVEAGSTEGLNGTYEPAGIALRVLEEQITGRQAQKREEWTTGVYALRFAGPSEDVIALWTLDFSIRLAVSGKISRAVDYMGNPVSIKTGTSNRKTSLPATILPLDGYALYLHVPHGGKIALVSPPLGRNVVSQPEVKYTASSSSKDHPAEFAFDGRWAMRDATPGLPDRTYWEADAEGASPEKPVWLQADFAKEQRISRSLLLTPLPAVDGGVPRDYALQVSSDGVNWKTIASVKDWVGWADLQSFPPVTTKHARLLITRLNDGWHLDGRWMFMVSREFTRYTSMKARVLDWQLFAP